MKGARLVKWYITLTVIGLILGASLFAQDEIEREVVVWFKTDIIKMPKGRSTANLSEVEIISPEILNTLQQYQVEVIVQPFPDFNSADTLRILPDGSKYILVNLKELYKLRLTPDEDREKLVDALKVIPGVRLVQLNHCYEPLDSIIPNDPHFNRQWGLHNTGQAGGVSDVDINAPQVWDIFKGSNSLKIGVIDWGIRSDHKDLSGRVTGDPGYSGGHGTHIAGIVAAKTDNDTGVAGVNWYAEIVSKKFTVPEPEDPEVYEKVTQAVDAGCHVLNASWRVKGSLGRYSILVGMAFDYAYKQNRFPVAAAGNHALQGNPAICPARYGMVFAVGALKNIGERPNWSSYGYYLDVVAPGGEHFYPNTDEKDIYSTWPPDTFEYLAGTSMSAPFAAGLGALLKGYKSNLDNEDIEWIIKYSAKRLPQWPPGPWDEQHGYGLIQSDSALKIVTLPYQITDQTATGGSDYSSTGWHGIDFPYRQREPNQSGWQAHRHEVRKTVSFPYSDYQGVFVWGRKQSEGWSPSDPYPDGPWIQYEYGWCEPVPETQTQTSVTLRTYVYEVQKVNNAGQPYGDIEWWPTTPANVDYAYAVLGRRPISAPSNLQAQGIAENTIKVTWTDNSNNEMGFIVERSINGTNFSVIDTVSYHSYTDTDVQFGTTYWYRVRAYAQDYYSDYSNIDSATTIRVTISSPQNGATWSYGNTYTISWTVDAADDVDNQELNIGGNVVELGGSARNYSYLHVYMFEGYYSMVKVTSTDVNGNYDSDIKTINTDVPMVVYDAYNITDLSCSFSGGWATLSWTDLDKGESHAHGTEPGTNNWWRAMAQSSSPNFTYEDPHQFESGECARYWVGKYGPGDRIHSDPSTNELISYSDVISACYSPGCPFIYAWDGEEFVEDNNILAASEEVNSGEVTDYYKFEQLTIEKNHRYLFQLREFEQEHTWLDEIELLAIDHPADVQIGVTWDGDILAYEQEITPVSCVDTMGKNHLELVSQRDSTYFQGIPGDQLIIDFGQAEINSEDAIHFVIDRKPPPPESAASVAVSIYKDGCWQRVGTLLHRKNWWSQWIHPIESGTLDSLKIKLSWYEEELNLDYVALVKVESAQFITRECPLVSAIHSRMGSVMHTLHFDDDNYAELVPGDTIQLAFTTIGKQPNYVRDFVLVSTGYYEYIEGTGGTMSAGSEVLSPAFGLCSSYPNPFNSATQIKFAIPKEAQVSLEIHDVTGRLVKTLVNGKLKAGYHTIIWQPEGLASGIYFAKLHAHTGLETGNYTEVRKLILVR